MMHTNGFEKKRREMHASLLHLPEMDCTAADDLPMGEAVGIISQLALFHQKVRAIKGLKQYRRHSSMTHTICRPSTCNLVDTLRSSCFWWLAVDSIVTSSTALAVGTAVVSALIDLALQYAGRRYLALMWLPNGTTST